MDEEYMRRKLASLKKGDIVKYNHSVYGLAYMTVNSVENGFVKGDLSTPRDTGAISIDDLIKANVEVPIGWKSEKDGPTASTD